MVDLVLDRWLHVVAGITWIGLLYYFNLVQVPGVAAAKAEGNAAGITKHIAPRALLWFRWSALVTWVSGAYYLERHYSMPDVGGLLSSGIVRALSLRPDAALIGIGAWLGSIMLFNVWVLIWPNQKKILGLVPADDATKAKAARIAFLASRTNTMLSLPMTFFMVYGAHKLF